MVKKITLLFILIFSSSLIYALDLSNSSNISDNSLIENETILENISQLNVSSDLEFEIEINNSKEEIVQVKKKLIKKSSKDYKIKINGEEFIPDEISVKKMNKLNSEKFSEKKKQDSTHFLVQFYNKLSKVEITRLKQEGVIVLEGLGSNAYFVSFKDNKLLSESSSKKFDNVNFSFEIDNYLDNSNAIRSISEVDSNLKLSKNLKEDKVKDWAVDDEGNVFLIIHFYKDVSLEEAEKLIKEKGFEVVSRLDSINALTIKVYGGDKSE